MGKYIEIIAAMFCFVILSLIILTMFVMIGLSKNLMTAYVLGFFFSYTIFVAPGNSLGKWAGQVLLNSFFILT